MNRSPERRTEPIFFLPPLVLALVAGMVLIQAVRFFLSPDSDLELLAAFSFVPAKFTIQWNPLLLPEALEKAFGAEAARDSGFRAELLGYLAHHPARYWTFLTYAFLHGGWDHLIFNMVWLAAFGTPLARRFDPVRFMTFFLLCAVAGAAFHLALNAYSLIPMIGASAGISGLMAGAAQFVFRSEDVPERAVHLLPRQNIRHLLSNRSAVVFIGFWFAMNVLFGLFAPFFGFAAGGIAWQAHIGGFTAGFLIFPWLDRLREQPPGF